VPGNVLVREAELNNSDHGVDSIRVNREIESNEDDKSPTHQRKKMAHVIATAPEMAI
jgi:hypothetical protein